jgi:transposase
LSVLNVGDIPILMELLKQSGMVELLDGHFSVHGNWEGSSVGEVVLVWLSYILSESDHRLTYPRDWVEKHLSVLQSCSGNAQLRGEDLTADKLGYILDLFSDEDTWDAFEGQLNGNLLHVYALDKEKVIRLDATIAQQFRKVGGWFRMGHSKHHRSDLPQIKVMLATQDPTSMPLASVIVPGNEADDGLYIAVMKKVAKSLAQEGLLHVGDAKLSGMGNRAYVVDQHNYYLCPLSKLQFSTEKLEAVLASAPAKESWVKVYKDKEKQHLMAEGFELVSLLSHQLEDKTVTWEERRLVVRSVSYAESQQRSLQSRLLKATEALKELVRVRQGRRRITQREELAEKIGEILQKYELAGLLKIEVTSQIHERDVRKYKDKPARIEQKEHFEIQVERDKEALEKHQATLGWRVYGSNAPQSQLPWAKAICLYRQEYHIEHQFNLLMNRILSLLPIFLKIETRVAGLIRLLLLALKFVDLIQYKVRSNLEKNNQEIRGMYPGKPNRSTDKPTTERILTAFKDIHLVVTRLPNGQTFLQLTPLNELQKQLLHLLELPNEIYARLNSIPQKNTGLTEAV